MLKAHLTSPLETESGSAHSLDGEDGLGELAKRMQLRLSSLSRSNSAASVHGSGRNSTSKLASLPGSKLSLASNPQRVDLDTTIKILHEVKKNASPEDLKALRKLQFLYLVVHSYIAPFSAILVSIILDGFKNCRSSLPSQMVDTCFAFERICSKNFLARLSSNTK